ncbi:hypothetical protein ET495_09105 [Xylanimonas allomyrinae]|uniref:Uncharacterized protein n=1 Tax=Xylanimonas allomyrinae TaxID=2509459 RepID=A0A4P6EPS8_9MICO|nr:hypothetical protein [Xylanimonas allomyrinae]QAY63379.1 hypothetical protein ET495_09105 [Xylanimonas allomyrinae]
MSPTPAETPATDPGPAASAPTEQQFRELKARVEQLEHALWVERDRAIGLEAQLEAAPGNAARVEQILAEFHASKAYRTTRVATIPFRAARKVVRMATGRRP